MDTYLGRYEIVAKLGKGAMGTVYKAYDPLIERFVALKSINLKILSEKERDAYKARFYQEAKAAGRLNHPNIVTIHDLGESGDVAYIAMELMEGRELQVMLDSEKRLPVEDVLNIGAQVASGLYFAHKRGIVHRDIKPSNIMVQGDNLVKIADFGIAQIESSGSFTRTGMIIGSPLYMSPEQISSAPLDARSDIFSLGVVLYQLLTGRLPFNGQTPHTVMLQVLNKDPPKPSSENPEIPDELDQIVIKCLEKKPENRYRNASELADALRACHNELLNEKSGLEHSFVSQVHFNHLKRMIIPGAISQPFVVISSFVVMALIFAIDMISNSRIHLHMLYIVPLFMISLHCQRIFLVYAAVILSLLLQGIILVTNYDLSMFSKVALALLVLPTNILIAYVSRIARMNFMEVGHLSSFDRLTGLRNRQSFDGIMQIEIDRQRQYGGVLSVAHIDPDNLDEFNNARGYQNGDYVLGLIADVLQKHTRLYDTAARLGRDFAILMRNTDAEESRQLCKLLSEKIAQSIRGAGFPISVSIGYVTFKDAPVSVSEVFQKARAATHEAQNSGEPYSVCGWHANA